MYIYYFDKNYTDCKAASLCVSEVVGCGTILKEPPKNSDSVVIAFVVVGVIVVASLKGWMSWTTRKWSRSANS